MVDSPVPRGGGGRKFRNELGSRCSKVLAVITFTRLLQTSLCNSLTGLVGQTGLAGPTGYIISLQKSK